MADRRLELTIKGVVQGVGFRNFVVRNVESINRGLVRRLDSEELTGEVINMKDGTVQLIAEGDERGLEHLIRTVWIGSIGSEVGGVSEKWGEVSGEYQQFESGVE